MNILLDESLPFGLQPIFEEMTTEHDFKFVQEEDWGGLKNGKLLTKAQMAYDVFITCDQNLPHQQHVSSYEIGIVILIGPRNRRQDLEPLVPEAVQRLNELSEGDVLEVPHSG